MSDNGNVYYQQDRRTTIRNFVLSEMMRGAGWAASVLFAIALLLWAIYGIGLLLPPDSKTAQPPMPFSQVQTAPKTALV